MQASSAISFRLPPASISAAASSGSPLAFRFRFPPFSRPDFPRPNAASRQLSDPRCFRSLSIASVLGSDYSASASSVPFSTRFCLALLAGARFPSRFPFFPVLPTWFPMSLPGSSVLGPLFVSFRPSLLRSHSRSTGARSAFASRFSVPFRALSTASVPFSATQLSALLFPLLQTVASHRLRSCSVHLSAPRPSPFLQPGDPCRPSGSSVLGPLPVSFRPSLLRSRSCSTGDDRHFRIWSLSLALRFLSSPSGFRR